MTRVLAVWRELTDSVKMGTVVVSILGLIIGLALGAIVYYLWRDNRSLKASVRSLHEQTMKPPLISEPDEKFAVDVGGESIELKALSGADFAVAFSEMREVLYLYAANEVNGKAKVDFDDIMVKAKNWIQACAKDEVRQEQWDRFTYPEAQHALATIMEANGITENLATFFRDRTLARIGTDGSEVQSPPESNVRSTAN